MFRPRRIAGISLLETMIATGVIAVIGAGLLMALTALQRNFAATKDYATRHGDEMRISDYLALDLRRALSVQISGSGTSTSVTLTVPNYYDSTGSPRMPVINSDGTVAYRDAGTPPAATVTVRFFLSGGAMIREENGVQQQLAVNVQDFQLTVLDSATDPNAAQNFNLLVSLAGKVAQVKTRISFNPLFRVGGATADTTKATTFYSTTLLRNARNDQAGVGLY